MQLLQQLLCVKKVSYFDKNSDENNFNTFNLDQYNSDKYEKYDYGNIIDLHVGQTSNNETLSWGAHHNNKTFDAMVNDILDDNDLDLVEIETQTNTMFAHRLYLPFLGNCLQYIHTFKNGNYITVYAKNFSKPLAIYVTDPNYSTNYGIKIDSQVGDNIR